MFSRHADPGTLNVFVQSHSDFQQLLDFLNNLGKRYSLFFLGNKDSKPVIDLGKIAKPNVTKLYIHQTVKYCMVVGNDMELCTHLTHLSIFGKLSVPEHTMQILGDANKNGKFPKLRYLRFAMTGGAKRKVKGKLDCMFSHPWKTLTHLDLGRSPSRYPRYHVPFKSGKA